jgi:hypothetical protein
MIAAVDAQASRLSPATRSEPRGRGWPNDVCSSIRSCASSLRAAWLLVVTCHVTRLTATVTKGRPCFGLSGSMAAGARVVAEDRGAQPVA